MRILLHTCCGPCLIEPLSALRREHDVTTYFANPNIQPTDEFELRKAVMLGYAAEVGVPVVQADHQPELWHSAVDAGLERPERCHACYRLRLGMTARAAADLGFDAIATTLTVSPYQDPGAIRTEGETAARDAGVRYLHSDFRERYPDAVRRARDLGMYRQNYCGCAPSKAEAEAERAERRAVRQAAREARIAAVAQERRPAEQESEAVS